ncbi:MAG: STAS-like domain-containing protein [Elusimicrobiota bacterium]
MKSIRIRDRAGAFAENKDVVLDFEGVEAVTQSFIHALISDAIRKLGSGALDHIEFKSCNDEARKIIAIVADYMQEGAD